MRSNRLWLAGVLASVAGCVDDPPAPDISRLSVVMRWEGDDKRSVEVSIKDPLLPCKEKEEEFLSPAMECQSTPWRFSVDGVVGLPSPVTCWSAYNGFFGHRPRHCDGGVGRVTLAESDHQDVEIIATTDSDETVIVVPNVRRTHLFVQERSFHGGQPGVVRVDGLELELDTFGALYSQPDGSVVRDTARPADGNRLHLSPYELADGDYHVRLLAVAHRSPDVRIAVPIEGTLTVGP